MDALHWSLVVGAGIWCVANTILVAMCAKMIVDVDDGVKQRLMELRHRHYDIECRLDRLERVHPDWEVS